MPGTGAAGPLRCVVAGAGVLGVCLAMRLAEAGAEVTLLDQDQPGQAVTRSSFAWLNSNAKTPRAYHELNHAGVRAWERLAGSLGGPAWHRPAGNLEWAANAPGRTELGAHLAGLIAAELLSGTAAAELAPYRPGRFAARYPQPSGR